MTTTRNRVQRAWWLAVLGGALIAFLLAAAPAGAKPAPLIAAAGDISCTEPNPDYNFGLGTGTDCQELATSGLLDLDAWSAVLPLGDLTYDDAASLVGFQTSYEQTWGRWKAVSHPAIGNHEYDDHLGAQGYWDYWNGIGVGDGPAGVRGRGWYAYDVGSWRLIALNSNCHRVRCGYDSSQTRFLRHQLYNARNRCTLVYFHHPRYSSGRYEARNYTTGFWKAMYRNGADVVLNGHEHVYERFAPQTYYGTLDRKQGVQQFTVGTGGYFLFPFTRPTAANSRFKENDTFGVLKMRLSPDRYHWDFMAVPDGHSLDSGSRRCHNEPLRPRRKHHRHHHH